MDIKNATLGEVMHAGYQRGRSIASRVTLPAAGPEEAGHVRVWAMHEAGEVELNDRDFSPFEFTAAAINARDDSEAAWDVYDQGISDGITDEITLACASYHKACPQTERYTAALSAIADSETIYRVDSTTWVRDIAAAYSLNSWYTDKLIEVSKDNADR